MVELPSEIMYDIFSRMPVKSLARFRCVSKPWCSYINDPYLETMHAKRAAVHDPLLLMLHQLSYGERNSPCALSFSECKEEAGRAGSCTLEVRTKPPASAMPMGFMCNSWYNISACNGLLYVQWRSLTMKTGGSKTYIPKNFYRTGGSKTYIPKKFYTKTIYITLLSEKFGGSDAPPGPS
ncbi:putative F-box domain-containing protein [Helianthus annuus]|uniref:F-box domain-containing protein n=1 Tax=Helianthus annuus TaxID=4232 RepID=A0A9K3HE26_HELAN|nr:putative F-box domain-containing protein [Helianthus annuus]KAJ0483089.1 putative F-box domain-containing protein [Helianthus annuus]KAJ0499242.1 putative F-box domain-containing protein [Helianthus annuus]KAJ0665258.1 putative F-box domain-containing protein [Helianthus annuus]KAJ0860018.1 putative F-box domain-containing protein [Helianthus annuus]